LIDVPPESSCRPDHEPLATQDVASRLCQVKVTESPTLTISRAAENVSSGAPSAIAVTRSETIPPSPSQVRIKVFVRWVRGGVTKEPPRALGLVSHAPVAVHRLASWTLQLIVVLCPIFSKSGLAAKDEILGTGNTPKSTDFSVEPPAPVHCSVKTLLPLLEKLTV
jgi:hypothetical protein